MARPKKRFSQLIEEIDRTPWGPQEQALVAEAIGLAQELGDEKLEYQARMRQTASANMTGLTEVMLTSFAWCLAHHDADPRRFPADLGNGGADLMWQFKWMAAALRSSPAFSQEQISAVLDDMDAHYRQAALGVSGVLTARFEDAWDAGRFDEAEKLRIQLEATPRDDYSHCDACSRSQVAGFFADTDRDADAIRLVEEMIEGGFSCGEEPEHALSRVLLPYLRAGRFDEARSAHLRSYRLAKDNADNLTIVANNIVFCAVTGNEARALSLIERHIGWLAHDGLNVAAHFTALSAIAFALDRVTAAGHGDTPVRGADAAPLEQFFGAHDGVWSAADLAAAAWAGAERIGAAFDARDGGDAHARRLQRTRGLADAAYDVPIRSDAFVAPTVADVPTDAMGWYRRAEDLAGLNAAEDFLTVLPQALQVEDAELRARLMGTRLSILVSENRHDEATALLPERIATLREAGRDAQAALEERVGLAVYGAGGAAGIAALDRELAGAEALPADVRGDVELSRASLHIEAEEFAAGMPLLDRAEADFCAAGEARLAHTTKVFRISALLSQGDADAAAVELDSLLAQDGLTDGRRAFALGMRARLAGGREDFAAGAADADEACRITAALGSSGMLASTQLLAAALWEDGGDAERAISRYRLASRLFAQEGMDTAPVDFRLARAMFTSGADAEAAELFAEVLQKEEQAGAPAESRAVTASMLARALGASGEFGQSYGAFGHAAQLFDEAGEHTDQAMAMTQQAKLLGRFDEHAEAIELLESAASIVRRDPEDLGALTEVLHSLGQAYAGQRDPQAFALFDEVTAIAEANEAAWLIADVADSRARALANLGRTGEAVSTGLTAADRFAQLGDLGAAGGTELFVARVLVEAQRDDEAAAVYRTVLDHAAEIPPLRQVAALELGDALERLGRRGEAAEARAVAEA